MSNYCNDERSKANSLRFERVSCLQAFGVVNREKVNPAASTSADAKKSQVYVGRWILEHDPEQYALDNYEKALAHLQSWAPFQNTNISPGVVFTPWTIDVSLEAQSTREPTVLDGDWDQRYRRGFVRRRDRRTRSLSSFERSSLCSCARIVLKLYSLLAEM